MALPLAWVAANLYLWHAIRSQELLLVVSAGMGAVFAVPFWCYVTSPPVGFAQGAWETASETVLRAGWVARHVHAPAASAQSVGAS